MPPPPVVKVGEVVNVPRTSPLWVVARQGVVLGVTEDGRMTIRPEGWSTGALTVRDRGQRTERDWMEMREPGEVLTRPATEEDLQRGADTPEAETIPRKALPAGLQQAEDEDADFNRRHLARLLRRQRELERLRAG